jgi:hypothetical protein
MAFREDDDARIARIDELERELARAREELERLAGVEAERDRLAARVEELEGQLGIRAEKERKKERARAEQQARDERAARDRTQNQARSPWKDGGEGRALLAGVVILVLGVGGAAAYFHCAGKSPGELLGGPPPPPSLGVIDLDATPTPSPVSAAVTTDTPAPDGCRGYLPDAPQLVLRTTRPMIVRMSAHSSVDLVAMILTPDGAPPRCDDDTNGTDPALVVQIPAGDSRLYVGTYAPGSAASFEVHLAAVTAEGGDGPAGLAVAGAPHLDTVRVERARVERTLEGVVAAPWIPARELSTSCAGFVAREPDLVVDLAEEAFVRLETRADADLVMLMAEPDGHFVCDDDGGIGNAPRIAKRLPAGRYPVWIGPYAEDHAGAAFQLFVRGVSVDALGRDAPTPIAVNDGEAATFHGRSGDDVAAVAAWPACTSNGFVPLTPQGSLSIAARRDLVLRLSVSATPFFAVVRDGSLVACVDDASWRGTVQPGRYDVYVGAPNDTAPADFELEATVAPPSVLPYTP